MTGLETMYFKISKVFSFPKKMSLRSSCVVFINFLIKNCNRGASVGIMISIIIFKTTSGITIAGITTMISNNSITHFSKFTYHVITFLNLVIDVKQIHIESPIGPIISSRKGKVRRLKNVKTMAILIFLSFGIRKKNRYFKKNYTIIRESDIESGIDILFGTFIRFHPSEKKYFIPRPCNQIGSSNFDKPALIKLLASDIKKVNRPCLNFS